MAKKLLNKTTNSFLLYAIIILLISAPVFYFACSWLYVYETDEVLLFHKGAFLRGSNHYTERDIAQWNKYNHDVTIVADMGVTEDSIAGEMLFDSIAGEKEPFRILYSPVTINKKRYTYIEKTNLVEMEAMLFSIAIMFLLIIVILLVGIIWISRVSSAKIWKPFYDTLNQIRNFEIDKNNPPRFKLTDIDEFDRLNKSVENLIEKNQAIYVMQKEFVENAAHELQTPLALFQSKIDTLFQSEELTKEQSLILNSLNSDVGRLNRLNKNLLLLSKIENENYLEKQPVSINDLLKRNMDFFVEQSKAKNLTLITEFVETITIDANPTLTEVLVNNLFLNAIRHNTKDGKIVITVTNGSVTFINSGQKTALRNDKLFNRFSKIDSSGQGNGLGLAIVKKIVDLNGWKIHYEFTNNLHSFNIRFD